MSSLACQECKTYVIRSACTHLGNFPFQRNLCVNLADIVDHNEPTMLIVGSRGLGQLNG